MTIDGTSATVSQPLKLSNADNIASSSTYNGGSSGMNGSGTHGQMSKKRKIKSTGKITLTSLTENNLGTLKTIILTVCEKHFSDKMYKTMLDPSLEDINKLIYYNDIPVGVILCRMVPKSKEFPDENVLEVAALVVLAKYRSLGLGTALLSNALLKASTTSAKPTPATKTAPAVQGRKKAVKAMLHVEEGNEYNKVYYTKKCGFEVKELVEGYYKDQPNSKAWLLEKDLTQNVKAES